MALFLGIHKIPEGMSLDDAREGWSAYKQNATEMGINPLHTAVSLERGFAYCQTEADSAEKVKEAHEKAGVPVDDVVEITKFE